MQDPAPGGGVATALGPLVAAGRTSDVYEFGADAVVKVPRPETPPHWARMEARFTQAVRTLGLPAPAVRGVTMLDGRESIVFDRIDGPSMWELMRATPEDAPGLARRLAGLQREIHAAGLADGIPGLVARTQDKISEARELSAAERARAQQMADDLPAGAALLHGDLHPGNVLMSEDGPVVIDWFDAAIGHRVADVVRSAFLLRPREDGRPPDHLPGAEPGLLEAIRTSYLDAMGDVMRGRPAEADRWHALVAASRLGEGAADAPEELLALWRG